MEEVQGEVAALDDTAAAGLGADLPSIGVSGEIRVPPRRRQEFLDDLRDTLQDLFARYGGDKGDAFRLALACYPAYPKETS
jgi:hypothetical protein